jgi:hypothetical protein
LRRGEGGEREGGVAEWKGEGHVDPFEVQSGEDVMSDQAVFGGV